MENQKDKKKKKVLMPFGLRNKLIAAISMLLVSSIMMVSSTYAWFTLSTAPEVKGISTSVGANGNLEIALLNSTGDLNQIKSNAGDSAKKLNEKNLTWGNLLDLSYNAENGNNFYGLDKIQLMPARLDASETDGVLKLTSLTSMLKIPTYGTDGRVDDVNVLTYNSADYDSTKEMFKYAETNATYGVRAIGVSGDLSAQQVGLNNAKNDYNLHMQEAQKAIRDTLRDNMQKLADAVIGVLTKGDAGVTENQKDAIQQMITASNTALEKIDAAYGDVLKACAASQVANASDYETLQGLLKNMTTYTQIKEELAKPPYNVTSLPDKLESAYTDWETQKGNVTAAQTALGENRYKDALYALIDVENTKVGGYKVAKPAKDPDATVKPEDYKDTLWEPKNNEWKLDLIKAAGLANGTTIELLDNSGVFAYVGAVAGTYSASNTIDLNIQYGTPPDTMDVSRKGVSFTITTNSVTADTKASGTLAGLNAASATGATKYITDTYGYVVDLAFRTNAADSKLRLSSDGIQRIYNGEEGSVNTETLGAGSTMTFKNATGSTLDNNAIAKLMGTIRVVFFNPEDSTIYGIAAMNDITEVTVAATPEGAAATTEMQGKLELMTPTFTAGKLTLTAKTAAEGANDLMALTQNTAAKMSVLVYLDGDEVDNSMVANAAKSIEGKLNLQFTSSAELVPMKNSQLFNGK